MATKTATLVDEGKTKWSTSNVAKIADSFVAILNHPAETKNKLVFIESFTTTQLEVLAALEKVSGEKWTIENKKSEDVKADGFKALGEGNLLVGGAALITAAVLGKSALEDHTNVEGGIWNDRLGLVEETVEQSVKNVYAYLASK